MDKSWLLFKDGVAFNQIAATPEFMQSVTPAKLNADEVRDITGTQFGIGCTLVNGVITKPAPVVAPAAPPTVEERLKAAEQIIATLQTKVNTLETAPAK